MQDLLKKYEAAQLEKYTKRQDFDPAFAAKARVSALLNQIKHSPVEHHAEIIRMEIEDTQKSIAAMAA